MEVKSSSEVETILNSVYGALRSRMSFNAEGIFHDFSQAAQIRNRSTIFLTMSFFTRTAVWKNLSFCHP